MPSKASRPERGGREDGGPGSLGAAPAGREGPVGGAGGDEDGSRCERAPVLQLDSMRPLTGLERECAIGRRGPGAELTRLGDRAAGQLGAADPAWKAEVVLDPARRPSLAAEHGALDDEGVESFGGPVHGRGETSRAATDHGEVDHLARFELEPDPERSRELSAAR